MFIWFTLCLLLGALIHSVIKGAIGYRAVAWLTVPGTIVRKLSQALTALVCGARVSRCDLYEAAPRDIEYGGEWSAKAADMLVPLAPIFGCVLALSLLNGPTGSPLSLDYGPPPLPSLDLAGLRAFLQGLMQMAFGLLQQVYTRAGLGFIAMLLLACSFSVGISEPVERLKMAIPGVGIVVLTVAVLSGLATSARLPAPLLSWLGISSARAGMAAVRAMLVDYAGRALMLVFIGLGFSLAVGLVVRTYELATSSGSGSSGQTRSTPIKREPPRQAA